MKESLIDAGENPVRQAERQIAAEQIRVALRTLTPEQQQVIVLKFLEGLSNKEVAAILGKTEGAVKSLQHRALASMQRTLMTAEERVAA